MTTFKISRLALSPALFAMALAMPPCARGQIIAWDVNGTNASTSNPFAATTLDGLLSSAHLSLGSGVTASATNNTFGGTGFNQTTLAGAISSGDYLAFTVTPVAATNLGLTSISLLFGVSTAVTNFNIALVTSATGFATGDALWSFSFNTVSPAGQTVSLSEFPELQNIDSALELRVYGWRDTTGTTTFRIRDNAGHDVSMMGSVSAIPEPSTYAALLGLAVFAFAFARRHARHGGEVCDANRAQP